LSSVVIPGRREAASPESMNTVRAYGYRAPGDYELREAVNLTSQFVAPEVDEAVRLPVSK
jgi:hypothetical protein